LEGSVARAVGAWFASLAAGMNRAVSRWPRLQRALPALAVIVIAWLVLVAVWGPFLASRRVNNGLSDWSYRTDYMAYALNAMEHDHQFPYWVTLPKFEQFRAKGIHDFFANPETEVLSITTPLAALFNYLVAVKVEIVLCLLLGVIGCRRTLRALGGSGAFPATLLLALLFLANGALAAHTLIGHTQFVTVMTFPLAFALFIEAWQAGLPRLSRVVRAGGAGALLAVAYYGGDVHPLIHFFLFLGLFTAGTILLHPRSAPRILGAASAMGIWFFALAAFKLLPGVLDYREYRANHFLALSGWYELARNWVLPWRIGQAYLCHEFNAYIGWAGVAVLAFAVLGWNRRTVPLVVAALVLSLLMMMKPGSPALEWPILRTQGVYTRMRIWVIFALALAGVVRIEAFWAWARRRGGAPAAIAITAVLVALDVYVAIDLGHINIWDDVSLSCVHGLPKAEGPFDEAPHFDSQDPKHVRIIATGASANVFWYRFAQDGVDGTVLVSPEIAVKPRLPHLGIEGNADMMSVGDRFAVRLHGKEGKFSLVFYDPVTYVALALSVMAWLLLALLSTSLAVVWRLRQLLQAVAARFDWNANPQKA